MDAFTPRSRRTASVAAAIGWRLGEAEREALLERFPPAYPQVHARHVTLKSAARPRDRPPGTCRGRIVGYADDDAGMQCLVVEIEDATVRWDGGVFHLCWSLDPSLGRRPVEANGVIAWLGWTPVEPVEVTLLPVRF
jgi:hypothetical protein